MRTAITSADLLVESLLCRLVSTAAEFHVNVYTSSGVSLSNRWSRPTRLLLRSRSLPAVCGGDVRAVAGRAGRGGGLHRAPALGRVSRLPALPQLRPLLHVRSHRHLLLLPGRPSLPPRGPNHPDSLPLTLAGGWSFCYHHTFDLFISLLCKGSVDNWVTATVWRSQALCSRIKTSQPSLGFEKYVRDDSTMRVFLCDFYRPDHTAYIKWSVRLQVLKNICLNLLTDDLLTNYTFYFVQYLKKLF